MNGRGDSLIYLDNAATTRMYPKAIQAATDVMTNYWANPSSSYSIADNPRILIENVRQQFADDLNCTPEELIFTSSGCEANNLAILGFLKNNTGYEFYTSDMEHASINEFVENRPATLGHVTIPVNEIGQIKPDKLRSLFIERQKFSNRKPFVSIQAANSEIGVKQDIKALAEIVHQYDGIIYCDAVQLFPEQRIDVDDWNVDMLSISAQKFHGGRGTGVLFVRDNIEISPIIFGSQENHRRGGSYNTAAIVAAGKALEITRLHDSKSYVESLRDKLLNKLLTIPNTRLNGPKNKDNRLVNNISLTIDGVSAERLVTLCDLTGVMIAKGSACQSHDPTPSKALLAVGLTPEQALSTIRITLDEFNTEEEIDQAASIISKLVWRIRNNEA
jgi:cysteine desulfurase